MKPLVSICCVTFNHVDFIENAIDSFLNQKVNFPIEIIINDDCSTDGTTEKLLAYRDKFPETIKLVLHDENEWRQGKRSIFARNTFPIARGKYIAMCEGDDFWCDTLKLQKQVDFLEANENFTICYHRVYELNANDERVLENLNSSTEQIAYSIQDLAKGNLIHTCSVLFRKTFDELPAKLRNAAAGDYVIHMLNARHGKIMYLPDPMAVYRTGTGYWSSQDDKKRIKNWIKVLDLLIEEFKDDNEVFNILQHQKSKYEYQIKKDSFLYKIYKIIRLR